jgi:toxin HigB-1
MIKTFLHKGLQRFFETGSKAGIRPDHASKLSRLLARLEVSKVPEDMNQPGWYWHSLTSPLAGHYAVKVNGNWRLTFRFENGDAVLVDYQDYH